jgi:hypothetical protein
MRTVVSGQTMTTVRKIKIYGRKLEFADARGLTNIYVMPSSYPRHDTDAGGRKLNKQVP